MTSVCLIEIEVHIYFGFPVIENEPKDFQLTRKSLSSLQKFEINHVRNENFR